MPPQMPGLLSGKLGLGARRGVMKVGSGCRYLNENWIYAKENRKRSVKLQKFNYGL